MANCIGRPNADFCLEHFLLFIQSVRFEKHDQDYIINLQNEATSCVRKYKIQNYVLQQAAEI